MKVSVIIPFFNEEDYLKDCLVSLSKQTLRDFEIILIDDGSTDNSKKVADDFKNKFPHLKLLSQNHNGPGAGRNLGAKKAKGEILVFVDADMTFSSDFLEKLIAPIIEGETRGTFSKQEYVSNWKNVWARCWNIEQGWTIKMRHPDDYPNKQKVFRAILKKEFDKVGGFTPGGYTDDYSLSDKLGYLALEADDARFYHRNPENSAEVFEQAKWSAKRDYKLGKLGYVAALLRSSLPVSLIMGIVKSIKHKEFSYISFKIVYDLGITFGILIYMLTGRGSK